MAVDAYNFGAAAREVTVTARDGRRAIGRRAAAGRGCE